MAEASLISLLMLWVMEHLRKKERGTSLVVQWLRLCTYNAGCTGSVPDWGTKIPHASGHGQKKTVYTMKDHIRGDRKAERNESVRNRK